MTNDLSADEIKELIIWAKHTVDYPFACNNARESALETLIEYDDPANKDHWLEIRAYCRGNGDDYAFFPDLEDE
jgi:hypothetical protein